MYQGVLVFILRNFWRLLLGLLGLCGGLVWAIFGVKKTLVILCVAGLCFYLGKWIDEGRPGGSLFRFLRKYLE